MRACLWPAGAPRITGVMSLPLARGFRTPGRVWRHCAGGAVRLSFFNESCSPRWIWARTAASICFMQRWCHRLALPYGDADVGKSIAGYAPT